MSANAQRFARTAHHIKDDSAHSFYRLMTGLENAPGDAQAPSSTLPIADPSIIAYAAGKRVRKAYNLVTTTSVGRLPGKRKITHQYWAVTPLSAL